MINHLKNVKTTISGLFFGICLFVFSYCGAQEIGIKVDGGNEMVAVWHIGDDISGLLTIRGSYGTASQTTVTITDPLLVHAYNPRLAVSREPSATIRAVSVWKSYVLLTGSFVIQLAEATNTGWAPGGIVTFSDSNEIPGDDYKVDISADGTVITLLWSTYLIIENGYVFRLETSVNGGATWTTTYLETL